MALDVPESVAAHWYTAQKCLDPARHPSLAANLRHAIEAVAGARAARALVDAPPTAWSAEMRRAYLALLDRTIEQGARVSDVWLYLRTSFVAIERLAGAR